MWVIPEGVRVEIVNGVTFLACNNTWVALHPINTTELKVNEDLTSSLTLGKEADQWNGHRVLSAKGLGGAFCGVAVEVGEAPEFADLATSHKAVTQRTRVQTQMIAHGDVEFTGVSGKRVRLRFALRPIETGVWRDG
jgi:hypothetical protein